MNVTQDYLDYNTTNIFDKNQTMSDYPKIIMSSFVFIICCMGVPLNGIVIWLLGIQIKRNPFTVLILNLAIADFGFLIFMMIIIIMLMIINCTQNFKYFIQPGIPLKIFITLFSATYINGLFLLTAISIDRCVAVLFPIWHRCSRPKYLSSVVCVFLWIFSFFLIAICNIIQYLFLYNEICNFHLVVSAVLCLPLITTSTVILFFKICLKSKQIKRGRLLVMILITLLCFLILTLPLYIYVFTTHFLNKRYLFDILELNFYLAPSASLNSCVNPVVYFLVGRKKRSWTRESIKVIFQRVFREDEAAEI
ncbi:mas-related G-protein coupled receptor member H-like [Notechis scutatus]|uniref:Mas-related G-protein coupled receptor member H-like n=1 Tax=Notechis scutatus TaxID=8663 RepID=A0A6J1VNM6_9SAUR|nr:mas-related G-protein coupled receptor member H-like [Notechis scutatus]